MTRSALALDLDQNEPVRKRTLALVVLCLAQFGIVLAFQGTAIVMPEVEAALNLPVSTTQWLISANALAYGGLLLPAGRAADIFGHRRLFILGSALFGVASLAAGLAPTVQWLIAARILQGVGAALFTPAMIALLADVFPDGPERRRALAVWGVSGPLGGIAAILLGGALASVLGWRAMFLLGAPIAVPVVLMARAVLPDIQARRRDRLDPVGSVTGILGIAALIYCLSGVSNAEAASTGTLVWIVPGLVLLGTFARSERRAESPLVPRSLHRRWPVWQPIAVAFLHGAAINTPIVFYALFMQRYREATPLEIGLGFLPCNIAIIAASAASSRLAKKAGYRIVVVTGMVLIIVGLLTLTTIAPDRSYLATFLPGWLVFGLGVGASQVGIVGLATEQATEEERGVVGGLVSTFAQVGTAVGLALLVIVAGLFASDIQGYRAAFATGSMLALIGLALAIRSPRRDERPVPDEPVRRPGGMEASSPAAKSSRA